MTITKLRGDKAWLDWLQLYLFDLLLTMAGHIGASFRALDRTTPSLFLQERLMCTMARSFWEWELGLHERMQPCHYQKEHIPVECRHFRSILDGRRWVWDSFKEKGVSYIKIIESVGETPRKCTENCNFASPSRGLRPFEHTRCMSACFQLNPNPDLRRSMLPAAYLLPVVFASI